MSEKRSLAQQQLTLPIAGPPVATARTELIDALAELLLRAARSRTAPEKEAADEQDRS
jgi:hypothetical protein